MLKIEGSLDAIVKQKKIKNLANRFGYGARRFLGKVKLFKRKNSKWNINDELRSTSVFTIDIYLGIEAIIKIK